MWNNGTGQVSGVKVQDVLRELMDQTVTPDNQLNSKIEGLQQAICKRPAACTGPVCPSGEDAAQVANHRIELNTLMDSLHGVKPKDPLMKDDPGSFDSNDDGWITMGEIQDAKDVSEGEFKSRLIQFASMAIKPVPDSLVYDSSCRDLFFEWYADIQANCSTIGGKFYHRASQIPTRLFAAKIAQNGAIGPSPCHPGCGLLHPNMKSEDCCGGDGYQCKEGEGNCDVDSDCAEGLICGQSNCLWGGNDNCCTKPRWSDVLMEFRDIAAQLGWKMTQNWITETEDMVSEMGEDIFTGVNWNVCGVDPGDDRRLLSEVDGAARRLLSVRNSSRGVRGRRRRLRSKLVRGQQGSAKKKVAVILPDFPLVKARKKRPGGCPIGR